MPLTPKFYFLTEASAAIGMGHFMRCYALAEEVRTQGLSVCFAMTKSPPWILNRIEKIGATSVFLDELTDFSKLSICAKRDWLIVDSYQVNARFLADLQDIACVLYLDDQCQLSSYYCNLVLNASPIAVSMPYSGKLGTAILLAGPQYALIRRSFVLPPVAPIRDAGICILLGGSDPLMLTSVVLEKLREAFPMKQLTAIVGPANPKLEPIREFSHTLGMVNIFTDPADFVSILLRSELVVTAAGGTIGELCALGQLAIALVVADNQSAAFVSCPYPVFDARKGFPNEMVSCVYDLFENPLKAENIRDRARAMIDGLGASRVLEIMRGFV